jgi:hypothetical protein
VLLGASKKNEPRWLLPRNRKVVRRPGVGLQLLRCHSIGLDNAIADAVSVSERERDRVIADGSEQTLNERLGFLAHEFRNLINTTMLAVNVIKRGNVGIAGSTGAVLDRSLKGLQNLCERVLVDVRLRAGIPQHRERVLVSELIEESQVAAAIDANVFAVFWKTSWLSLRSIIRAYRL